MNGKTAAILLSGLMVACVQTQEPEATAPAAPPPPAVPAPAAAPAPAAEPAPVDHIVNIRGARCGDFMRLAVDDRAAATMSAIKRRTSAPEPSMWP